MLGRSGLNIRAPNDEYTLEASQASSQGCAGWQSCSRRSARLTRRWAPELTSAPSLRQPFRCNGPLLRGAQPLGLHLDGSPCWGGCERFLHRFAQKVDQHQCQCHGTGVPSAEVPCLQSATDSRAHEVVDVGRPDASRLLLYFFKLTARSNERSSRTH